MSGLQVTVTLTPLGPEIPLTRTLVLTPAKSAIIIGRSSKRGLKHRSPDSANGWYESRIVYIDDLGSTHGTWINNTRLPFGDPSALTTGDIVRFGVDVERDDEAFPALVVRCKIDWSGEAYATPLAWLPHTSADYVSRYLTPIPQREDVKEPLDSETRSVSKATPSPSTNTFRVPEDDSDVEEVLPTESNIPLPQNEDMPVGNSKKREDFDGMPTLEDDVEPKDIPLQSSRNDAPESNLSPKIEECSSKAEAIANAESTNQQADEELPPQSEDFVKSAVDGYDAEEMEGELSLSDGLSADEYDDEYDEEIGYGPLANHSIYSDSAANSDHEDIAYVSDIPYISDVSGMSEESYSSDNSEDESAAGDYDEEDSEDDVDGHEPYYCIDPSLLDHSKDARPGQSVVGSKVDALEPTRVAVPNDFKHHTSKPTAMRSRTLNCPITTLLDCPIPQSMNRAKMLSDYDLSIDPSNQESDCPTTSYYDGPFFCNDVSPNSECNGLNNSKSTTLKRKACEMELQDAQIDDNAILPSPEPSLQTLDESQAIAAITSALSEVEVPNKRIKSSHSSSSRVASYTATAVVSALLGGLGTIALLASLPAEYFQ
ncbi:uncharacterized protein N7483_000366 [Penicillium malachiteum]|uniref:uncharacterized protein n=1 Tax=Penicillium malachiteum TaxID=1324776 RepID=UPI0025493C63|nr:uncharacterized protein N7483_000366 [Penicillium malachiteum]KAJ5735241.1 hypothetical protein N7483_000366 [Penicillium malachiteum]